MKIFEKKNYSLSLTDEERDILISAIDILEEIEASCDEDFFNYFCKAENYTYDNMIIDSFERVATFLGDIRNFADIGENE